GCREDSSVSAGFCFCGIGIPEAGDVDSSAFTTIFKRHFYGSRWLSGCLCRQCQKGASILDQLAYGMVLPYCTAASKMETNASVNYFYVAGVLEENIKAVNA